jgi:hypothetical protein
MEKGITLKAVLNKNNNQINFSLKKKGLPKEIKDKLPNLKGIKLDFDDFEFKDFEEKWDK